VSARRWALAWAALCVAFALHVLDEAAHDFLSWYNPNVLAIRERVPWLPLPVFTFPVWIAGLALAVVVLAALTPLVRRGRPWIVPLAYAYGVVHVANALSHVAVSIFGAWLAPGVLSSPLLLAGGLWLLYETARWRACLRSDRPGAALLSNK
jgi:hypothetical protein